MNTAQLKTVGEILLKAAFSDGSCQGVELEEIRKILAEKHSDDLTDVVLAHLARCDVSDFQWSVITEKLDLKTPGVRRELVEMVARITRADGALTLDEDSFLRKMAHAIGATEADMEGFALDFESHYAETDDLDR